MLTSPQQALFKGSLSPSLTLVSLTKPVNHFCKQQYLIPASNFLPQVKARLQKMGILSPLNIFLRQEIDRMQRVIFTVRTTLQDLKLAIDGTIIMSETLRDALDNIYDARVPESWKKVMIKELFYKN